jgi:hypothetical protein
MGEVVKTREHTTEMLDCVDETFDQVSFSIQPAVIRALGLRPLMRGNDRFRAALSNMFNQGLRGVASVSNHRVGVQSCQQGRRLGNVVGLSAGQGQPQRIAQRIHHNMNVGAQPTSTPPQGLRRLSSAFLVRQQHRDAREQWCCQSSRFPYPHPLQIQSASAPTRQRYTSGQTACKSYSTAHTRRAVTATGIHCARSITRLQQNGGTPPLVPHRHSGLFSSSPEFSSPGRLLTSRFASDQFTSNVNTT